MIIAGWGKRGKDLAYLGIMKCPVCKNYSHFTLYQLANQVSLYFIPVAKFNHKYYVVCGICENGWEVDSTKKDEILRDSTEIPDRATVLSIWNGLDGRLAQTIKETGTLTADVLERVVNELTKDYPEEAVGYVYTRFIQMLTDEDKAR